jgi:hypothetical protein
MGQRYPLPITPAMLADANPNDGKPRYDSAANVAADWSGAVIIGEDPGLPTAANQAFTKANVALARSGGGANEPDYAPRNLNAKRTAGNLTAGTVGVIDIGRNRGGISPRQPYPVVGDAALAAPVVSSLSPNTAAAGSQPLTVTITGTGFTPYSRVISGGSGSPWDSSMKYLSATQLTVVVDPRNAVAGTASIAVEDHGVLSNTTVNFTFT